MLTIKKFLDIVIIFLICLVSCTNNIQRDEISYDFIFLENDSIIKGGSINDDRIQMETLFEKEDGFKVKSIAWSSDKEKIAIVLQSEGFSSRYEAELAVLDIQTLEIIYRVDMDFWPMGLDWSPDSKKLLATFSDLEDSNFSGELFIYEFQSKQWTQITDFNPNLARSGKWSPDGRSILYMQTSPGIDGEIVLWNLDENKELEITQIRDARREGETSFSPSGGLIAYVLAKNPWEELPENRIEVFYVATLDGTIVFEKEFDAEPSYFNFQWINDELLFFQSLSHQTQMRTWHTLNITTGLTDEMLTNSAQSIVLWH